MIPTRLLAVAQRLEAIAQAGLTYHTDGYDFERYAELRQLAATLIEEISHQPQEKIVGAFASENGYPTPKVDVRVVLFRAQDEILLVRERADEGRWTLPGGWADVGYSPFEMAVKEAREETGLIVRPVRLLALFDKRTQCHPPHLWYTYKAFIQCEVEAGELRAETLETSEARWFRGAELNDLDLSVDRVTPSELEAMLAFGTNPDAPALCD
jgi:ADP-ribose pyrophosphatase YjhB (NUDIX family)